MLFWREYLDLQRGKS